MANRIVYAIGLVFSFVLLLTLFILTRFSRETKELGTQVELLGDGTLYLRIDPSMWLREGILRPLLSAELTAEERTFFKLPDGRPQQLQETGINWLAPIYASQHQINGLSAVVAYLELSAPEEFDRYGKANPSDEVVFFNRGNRGVLIWSSGNDRTTIENYFNTQFGKADKPLVETLTQEEPETLLRAVQPNSAGTPHEVRLTRNVAQNVLTLSGEFRSSHTPLQAQLTPQKDAFYLLTLVPDMIGNAVASRFRVDSLVQHYLNDIRGLEMNYAGILQHPVTKKPHPRIELAVHTTSGKELLNTLREEGVVTLKHDSLIQFNDLFRGKYHVSEKGIWISSMNAPASTGAGRNAFFELFGNPAVLLRMEEPYRSIAFALDGRLATLNEFLEELQPFDLITETAGDGLTRIHGTYAFQSGKPVLFRSAYYLRQLVK